MSITDEVMGKAPDQMMKASDMTLKAAKEAKTVARDAAGAVKGICLILGKGVGFSGATVMKAVKTVVYKKTEDIKYSNRNIDISKLRKSGHVYRVEDNILAETMGCFDAQCKKHGIKYSAMKDTRGDKPSYMVFFEGRDTDTIMSVLKESYKDYVEKQEKEEGQDKTEEKKGRWRKKDNTIDPEKRESVKAKLAFFRDRVAARDAERGDVERHHQKTDIQR